MPIEAKNLAIYITILLVLIVIAVTVFVTQAGDIADAFFASIEEPENVEEQEEGSGLTTTYLVEGASTRSNLYALLNNFDPADHFTYCNESIKDLMVCGPITFNVTAEEKNVITYDDFYTVFKSVFEDDWKPRSFFGSIGDGFTTLHTSEYITFSNDCWTEGLQSDLNELDPDRIFVLQQSDRLANKITSDRFKTMIVFNTSKMTEFRVAVTICPE